MDNRLIFLYLLLLVSRDEEGYAIRMLVTGLSVKGVEKRRKRFELRHEYEILRYRSG